MSRVRDIANILSGVSTDMATDAEVTSSIASHAAAADPHSVYLKESEFNAAGKNHIINGAFDFWQRGTTFNNMSSGSYTADRFLYSWDGNGTMNCSRQTFTPGSAPVSGYEGTYFIRGNVGTAGTSTVLDLNHRVEDVRSLAGQTVTLSFWAKADSARTCYTWLIQQFGGGGSTDVYTGINANAFSVTTSWQRFTFTGVLPSLTGKTIGTNSWLLLLIRVPAATGAQLDIWGIQLESGSVATSFSRAGADIQGELAKCQRYYHKTYPLSVVPGTASSNIGYVAARSDAGNEAWAPIRFPVPMRVTPAISVFSPNSGNSGKSNSTGNVEYTAYGEAIGEFGFSLLSINMGGSAIQTRVHYVANAEL